MTTAAKKKVKAKADPAIVGTGIGSVKAGVWYTCCAGKLVEADQ